LSKLAAGHLDLHSRHSSIDLPLLAQWCAGHPANDAALQAAIVGANTSQEALAMALKRGVPLGDIVCSRARDMAREIVPASVEVEMFAIDRQGNIVGEAR
jgi:cobalt-precorrin-5B (C1)-methyltransferase